MPLNLSSVTLTTFFAEELFSSPVQELREGERGSVHSSWQGGLTSLNVRQVDIRTGSLVEMRSSKLSRRKKSLAGNLGTTVKLLNAI